jgi:hypothetical protein
MSSTNDYKAQVVIETLGILAGQLPPKVLSLAVEWAAQHRAELLGNWEGLRTSGNFTKIEPLA